MRREVYWNLIDLLKRNFFFKFELKKILLFILIVNSELFFKYRQFLILKLNVISIFSSKTIYNNRCLLTGRSYGINLNYNLSRFKLRTLINNGMVIGYQRYSW
jgi:ribosomal protein S14